MSSDPARVRLPPVVAPEAVLAGAGQSGQPVLLADVRWYPDGRDGRAAHAAGHLAGAVYVDLDSDLAGPPRPGSGSHPLPDPDVFAERMGALGIGDDTVVYAYDDAGGVAAARLVWMLRALDRAAALVDGGLAALVAGGAVLEAGAVLPRPATFTRRPWPEEQVADTARAADASQTRLDARPPQRFTGEDAPDDPRAGHIPGAVNLPWATALDGVGRLLPPAALRARFADAGVADGAEVVSYCGNGVGACHALLVAEHAGMGRGRLYPGSFSAYRETDLPVARD